MFCRILPQFPGILGRWRRRSTAGGILKQRCQRRLGERFPGRCVLFVQRFPAPGDIINSHQLIHHRNLWNMLWSRDVFYTWWLIPVSKWDITPVINGISRVNPLIIGVITLSGMSHQVVISSGMMWWSTIHVHRDWEWLIYDIPWYTDVWIPRLPCFDMFWP